MLRNRYLGGPVQLNRLEDMISLLGLPHKTQNDTDTGIGGDILVVKFHLLLI